MKDKDVVDGLKYIRDNLRMKVWTSCSKYEMVLEYEQLVKEAFSELEKLMAVQKR